MEIKSHLNTPYIKFDKENFILTIEGKSYPEHPIYFYEPILKEIIKYKDYMQFSDIKINLILEMMSSVSAKYILEVLKTIDDNSRKTNIDWYYEEDDEDMEEEGNLFKSFLPNTNFKLIKVKNLPLNNK